MTSDPASCSERIEASFLKGSEHGEDKAAFLTRPRETARHLPRNHWNVKIPLLKNQVFQQVHGVLRLRRRGHWTYKLLSPRPLQTNCCLLENFSANQQSAFLSLQLSIRLLTNTERPSAFCEHSLRACLTLETNGAGGNRGESNRNQRYTVRWNLKCI